MSVLTVRRTIGLSILALVTALAVWAGGRSLVPPAGEKHVNSLPAGPRVVRPSYPKPNKRLALTFDDGPSPHFVVPAVALLKHYRAKATFFCVGVQLASHKHLAAYLVDHGFPVEIHTFSHRTLKGLPPQQIAMEILSTAYLIEQQTGTRSTLVRIPYGRSDRQARHTITKLGYRVATWNLDPKDWVDEPISQLVTRVLKQAHDGSIMLLHEKPRTLQALPGILHGLRKAGYDLVTVEEMLPGSAGVSPAQSAGTTTAAR